MTKRTSGAPYRPGLDEPVITKVVFETTAQPNDESADLYARGFLARTVGHLERVDVGAIVAAYLEEIGKEIDPAHMGQLDADVLGAEILRITALVETVLDQARSTLRTRMAIEIATGLLPRLKGTRS